MDFFLEGVCTRLLREPGKDLGVAFSFARKAPEMVAHRVEYRSTPENAKPLGNDQSACSIIFLEDLLPCGTVITLGAVALPVSLVSRIAASPFPYVALDLMQQDSVAMNH